MHITTSSKHAAGRRTVIILAASLLIFVAAVALQLSWEGGTAAPAAGAAKMPDPVTAWQARVERRPGDAGAYAGLGLALLQKVRETNDATLYARAQRAFEQALVRDPQQLDALVGRGMLSLALHDFRGALALGGRIEALNPRKAAGIGVRVDALVELGRYADAITALQQMVDLRPDLESYSRVSYLRELYGDVPGAIRGYAYGGRHCPAPQRALAVDDDVSWPSLLGARGPGRCRPYLPRRAEAETGLSFCPVRPGARQTRRVATSGRRLRSCARWPHACRCLSSWLHWAIFTPDSGMHARCRSSMTWCV